MLLNVVDMRTSIFDGLRAMEWQRYLAAMWIICGELQDMYADELGDSDRRLIASTRELIKDIALGRATAQPGKAAELSASWYRQCKHEDEVSVGLACVWGVCQYLVGEVTEETGKYNGRQWLLNAVIEHSRTPEERREREHALYDPDQHVEDTSPLAKSLLRMQRIVHEVASDSGGDLDPVRLRAQILAA